MQAGLGYAGHKKSCRRTTARTASGSNLLYQDMSLTTSGDDDEAAVGIIASSLVALGQLRSSAGGLRPDFDAYTAFRI